MLSKRQKAIIAGAALATGSGTVLATFVVPMETTLAAVSAALRDPAALIAGRSPGDRGDVLVQSKLAAAPALRGAGKAGPRERVLDEARTRNPAIPPEAVPSAVEQAFAPPGAPAPLGAAAPGEVPLIDQGTPIGTMPPGGGGGVIPGGSSSGGGSSGGGSSGGGPVAPVPEPSTWALMTLGFGAIGIALRRRNRALSCAAADVA